jgi:hypothetical protein
MPNIQKDILANKTGIICHQVNCQGAFGAGLAKQIGKKWPKVQEAYQTKFSTEGWKLGDVQFVEITPNLFVANIAGQNKYGRDPETIYTNYDAVKTGLRTVADFSKKKNLEVHIPFRMGAGLANGNWETLISIIRVTVPMANICRIEQKPESTFNNRPIQSAMLPGRYAEYSNR